MGCALLRQGMPVQTINRSSGSDSPIRQQILTGINAGPRILNYIGHGSVGVWTGAGLLQTSDAGNLTNGNRLPLFVVMTCLNRYAHDAYIDSLSEALFKARMAEPSRSGHLAGIRSREGRRLSIDSFIKRCTASRESGSAMRSGLPRERPPAQMCVAHGCCWAILRRE